MVSAEGRWLVLVDVAPSSVHRTIDHALRDRAFIEILPCVYQSHWIEPDLPKLRRTLNHARRRGIGRIVLGHLDQRGLIVL